MRFGKEVYIIALVCSIGILLILGLSWQSSPNLKGLPLIPSWLYNWTDNYNNGRIRTAVPFIFLSLVIGLWFCIKRVSWRYYSIAWAILTGVVVLAEFGQYFIPLRDVDLKDIFWGSFGSGIGLGSLFIVQSSLRLLKLR